MAEQTAAEPNSPDKPHSSNVDEDMPMAATKSETEMLFYSIIAKASPNTFYKHQKRGDPDLNDEEKLAVLAELFVTKPVVFLERYHRFIEPCHATLFHKKLVVDTMDNANSANVVDYYLSQIAARAPYSIPLPKCRNSQNGSGPSGNGYSTPSATATINGGGVVMRSRRRVKPDGNPTNSSVYFHHGISRGTATAVRNRRYLHLLRLKEEGSYFSLEKMRERDPVLFDSMVGRYLPEEGRLHLRPTVHLAGGAEENGRGDYEGESRSGVYGRSEFTHLLEQLDETQRISDRRKRQLREEWGEEIGEIGRGATMGRIDEGESTSVGMFQARVRAGCSGSGSKMSHFDRFFHHVEDKTREEDADFAEQAEEFQPEFDSSDEEGMQMEVEERKRRTDARIARRLELKKGEKERKWERNSGRGEILPSTSLVRPFRQMKVQEEELVGNGQTADGVLPEEGTWISTAAAGAMMGMMAGAAAQNMEEEDEAALTGLSAETLLAEFVSTMEHRFLAGEDRHFIDYESIDEGTTSGRADYDRIRDQDMEDAYFETDDGDADATNTNLMTSRVVEAPANEVGGKEHQANGH